MTNQEIFDKVLTHLRAQGVAAITGSECSYRAQKDDGVHMCAVGCLIKDEFYDPNFEGENATDPRVLNALAQSLGVKGSFTDITRNLLRDLQVAHDHELDNFGLDDWEAQMKNIARNYELTYSMTKV